MGVENLSENRRSETNVSGLRKTVQLLPFDFWFDFKHFNVGSNSLCWHHYNLTIEKILCV